MYANDLFAGKKILVTGGGTRAGQGDGGAVSRAWRRDRDLRSAQGGLRRDGGRVDEGARRARSRATASTSATPAAVDAMVEDDLSRFGPLTGLVNNAAGNFISRTEDLSPRGFDAIANIVMHGTFYVTQAVGKRWIAGKRSGQRGFDRGHLGAQRRARSSRPRR